MRGRFSSFVNRRKKLLTFLQLLIWPTAAVFIAGASRVSLESDGFRSDRHLLRQLQWTVPFIEFCPPDPFGSLSLDRGLPRTVHGLPGRW